MTFFDILLGEAPPGGACAGPGIRRIEGAPVVAAYICVRVAPRLYMGCMLILLLGVSGLAGRAQGAGPPGAEKGLALPGDSGGGKEDPHWRRDRCAACHAAANPDARRVHDTRRRIPRCDSCHLDLDDHEELHPVAVVPPAWMKRVMPPEVRAAFTGAPEHENCVACHDVLIQCLTPTPARRVSNPGFLRGGPFRDRTAFCYQCHDRGAYARLDAHDQVTDDGGVRRDRCLLCHRRVPSRSPAGQVRDAELRGGADKTRICRNCHAWIPHPGGNLPFIRGGKPNHLVVPPPEFQDRMREALATGDFAFPLEPGSGRIYCATCHNPHERGVIPDPKLAAGADARQRLRARPLCENCHPI